MKKYEPLEITIVYFSAQETLAASGASFHEGVNDFNSGINADWFGR